MDDCKQITAEIYLRRDGDSDEPGSHAGGTECLSSGDVSEDGASRISCRVYTLCEKTEINGGSGEVF